MCGCVFAVCELVRGVPNMSGGRFRFHVRVPARPTSSCFVLLIRLPGHRFVSRTLNRHNHHRRMRFDEPTKSAACACAPLLVCGFGVMAVSRCTCATVAVVTGLRDCACTFCLCCFFFFVRRTCVLLLFCVFGIHALRFFPPFFFIFFIYFV